MEGEGRAYRCRIGIVKRGMVDCLEELGSIAKSGSHATRMSALREKLAVPY
jgi:hypothetical protein